MTSSILSTPSEPGESDEEGAAELGRVILKVIRQVVADTVSPADPAIPPTPNKATIKVLADWLARDIGVGGVFTIADAEQEVFAQTGRKRVETDRRIRDLRSYRWLINTYREDPSLNSDQHRLEKIGDDVSHPACRPQARGCSAPIRRAVFGRDNYTCQECGIRKGEEYPDQPGRRARMTIGRILPGSRGGGYTIENCRTECARCNEDVRDRYDYGEGTAS